MTTREAERLATKIQRDDSRIRVTGIACYKVLGVDAVVYCTDTRTGINFPVRSAEEWDQRRAASEL